MPSNPPGQPPSAPNITRTDSDTRQPDRCALHLSNPNTRNAAALNAANQMAANESGIFKRGLILAFCFQMACKFALANWLPRRESHPDFRFQRPAHFDYATRQLNMVAREGYAPSTSGCRPDVMLFHHRAVETRSVKNGCLAWICTRSVGVKARYAAVTPRGSRNSVFENWWPAGVTRPVLRIKSPLHHFNACRPKMVLAVRFALTLATLSTSCLCWLGYASKMKMVGVPGTHARFP